MAQRNKAWTEARGLVQQGGRSFLIVRPPDDDAPWQFPGGRVRDNESPEDALKRHFLSDLDAEIQIIDKQPPFVFNYGSHSVKYLYFVCDLKSSDILVQGVADARWVLTGQLRDYVFDSATQAVVDWLTEGDGRPK